MLVQYRLALYSILINLLNAMHACKVVELFLLATMACLTAWWNAILRLIEMSVSQSDVEELVHDQWNSVATSRHL